MKNPFILRHRSRDVFHPSWLFFRFLWFVYTYFLIYPSAFSNAQLGHVVCKLASIADVTEGNCANLPFLEGEFQT